jgi:putative transcriptional regulator
MPKRRPHRITRTVEKRFNENKMLREWNAVREAIPGVDAQFIKETRERLNCSRTLFAMRLCMNERTLENWEQGRAKPNSQAAVLLLLVRHFPDTLERLRRIATA